VTTPVHLVEIAESVKPSRDQEQTSSPSLPTSSSSLGRVQNCWSMWSSAAIGAVNESRRKDREIRGFRQLHRAPVTAYHGRNPRTGDNRSNQAQSVSAFFKVGKEARDERVNGWAASTEEQTANELAKPA